MGSSSTPVSVEAPTPTMSLSRSSTALTRPYVILAVSTSPLGCFAVGGGEDGLGEPLAEGGVVAEEVGVVGEHVGHGPFEGLLSSMRAFCSSELAAAF